MENHPDKTLFRVFIWYWIVFYGLVLIPMLWTAGAYLLLSMNLLTVDRTQYLSLFFFVSTPIALTWTMRKLFILHRRSEYQNVARYFSIPVIVLILSFALFEIGLSIYIS